MSSTILTALRTADPVPSATATQSAKTQHAVRLSNALAIEVADRLRGSFRGILPHADGSGLETAVGAASGTKRLDVNYSTPELGLGLGVSIKTITFRDRGSGRYTHNMKRVDEEFLAEAIDYHVRQPYAVLVGLYFLPYDACDDGTQKSSFGAWVQKFFSRSGRDEPTDPPARFEAIYIGLYETSGPDRGHCQFFDVRTPPPRRGRPSADALLGFDEMIARIESIFRQRNGMDFLWADDAPATPPDVGNRSA